MRRVVLDLQYAMFAQAISQALEGSEPDFLVLQSEHPKDTVALCRSCHAYAVILERLQLRETLRTRVPDCKTVLLVDEYANPALAAAVRQAKKDGLVDNFIYGSVSPTYLMAVLDTL